MKRINKIKRIGLAAFLAGASVFSSKAFAQDPYTSPKKPEQEINIPYLPPTTYTPPTFVSVHGLNQTSNVWSGLNQAMQNRGFQTTPIDLPNKGHMGWEQNSIVMNNTLSNIKGTSNTFFAYSTGGISMLRYMEENPKFIENNKGSTIILLDPAIKLNAPLEFLASLPMRPITAPIMGKLTPSATENELTRRDTNNFIETTQASLPKLAENLASNNWNVHVIGLNGEVVNGGSVKSMAETFKAYDVNVYQHTPADIKNNYTPPTIGNKGNFLGGDMNALKVPTMEFTRDSSSHFIWSNTYKLGIDKFVTDIASRPMQSTQSVKLNDIVSSSGVLQNYHVLRDNKLKVVGSSVFPALSITINPELFKTTMPSVGLQLDMGKYLSNYNPGSLNVIGSGINNPYLSNNGFNNPYLNNNGLNVIGNNYNHFNQGGYNNGRRP